jgi:hypothetical protein
MLCSCGHDSPTYSVCLTSHGSRTVCRNCTRPRIRESCLNPYAGLTLTHAHDEFDQPVRVDSLRQMQEAEKRYHFRSLVANEREADFDKPPQHRQKDLFEQMSETGNWLYPDLAESLVRELRETGELAPAN